MNYTIDNNISTPAYMQLYLHLRDDIIAGIYPTGSKLPSKRLLADETGVSVITTEHAYSLLCEEGYCEARQRSGYIVVFRTDSGFVLPGGVYETSLKREGEPSDFPFSVLAKTMRRVISEYGEVILERVPHNGCEELRRAISAYLAAARGIKTKPEQIIIGSGSEYLYRLVIEMLGRDRIYAIEDPSYRKIEQVYSNGGAVFEKLKLGTDGIESAELQRSRATVLHISPYRSFPSGVTASASKKHEYLRWASDGKIIIEDDFESEFSVSRKPEETLFGHTKNNNVIYMNSFTKTIGSGIRTGYAVLPEALLPLFEKQVGFYSCTVPAFEQYVLAELISNGDFERHINRTRRQKRKELEENKSV